MGQRARVMSRSLDLMVANSIPTALLRMVSIEESRSDNWTMVKVTADDFAIDV